MNRPERAVLQRHMNDLAEDLILTDKLLASFLQHKIFEQHMIELIKVWVFSLANTTPHDTYLAFSLADNLT